MTLMLLLQVTVHLANKCMLLRQKAVTSECHSAQNCEYQCLLDAQEVMRILWVAGAYKTATKAVRTTSKESVS